MKKFNIKFISFLMVLSILLPVQQVYAEELPDMVQVIQSEEADMVQETEDSVSEPVNPDVPVELAEPANPDVSEEPAEPVNPNEPAEPIDPNEPEKPAEPEQPENPEQPTEPTEPEENQIPSKVNNLHTTSQSQKNVLVEWDESEYAVSYKVYRKTGSGSYKQLTTTEENFYEDPTIVYGKNYRYKIVPVNKEDVEGEAASTAFSNKQAVNISKKKYTYKQMKQDLQELKNKYSNYCEMRVIGTSVKGRNLYDFAIGNPEAEYSLLVVSTLHAREYICSAIMMKEIEYYLQNYNKFIGGISPAKVLEDMQIHYVVMANPDGVTISQTKHPRWKSNARGVDLNRNFPAKKFEVGGKKGAEGYSGKKALSEPESKAVAELTKQLKKNQYLCGVVNYHAMGRIIYGSCTKKSLAKDTKKMYQIAQKETGYRRAYESSRKSPGGQYREYVMYEQNIPSITIEVGSRIAPCPYWEYESEFKKNKMVVLKIAKAL